MFNDSTKNSFTLSFVSWSTVRKTVDTQLGYQIDKKMAQNINNPKYLIEPHQIAFRIGVPSKTDNVAVFDNLIVWKNLVDIDSVWYSRDGVSFEYTSNDYLDQYRDLKLSHKEYLGKKLLNFFISYTDLKKKYPFQIIDLGLQVGNFNPQRIQLIEEYRVANNNARLFWTLVGPRAIKMISDETKINEVNFF